jgi:protein-disulfide isomerase
MGVRIARFTRQGLTVGMAVAAMLLVAGCGQSGTKTADSTASSASATSSGASSDTGKSVLGAPDKIEQLPDMTLGDPKAPVKIIEYASMTCPHCAHFDAEIFPELKKNYIDTGKVFYTFREFPLDGVALRASMIARCVGKDRFFGFLHGLFHTQIVWANPDLWNDDKKTVDEKLTPLATMAKEQAGMSREEFDKCVHNQTLQQQITMQAKRGVDEYKVHGTPSVFIDGKPFEEVGSYEPLDAKLKEILGAK